MPMPRTIRSLLSLLACAAFVAGAGGCLQPYVANVFPGPDRPDAEVAELWLHEEVRFVSLDGRPAAGIPRELPIQTGDTNQRLIRLLPGTHRIVVGIRSKTARTFERTQFEQNRAPGDVQPPINEEPSGNYDVPGSTENEELEFTVRAGRKYAVKVRNPPDWGSARERWSARVVDKTGPQFEMLVSTSLRRVPNGPTTRPLRIVR